MLPWKFFFSLGTFSSILPLEVELLVCAVRDHLPLLILVIANYYWTFMTHQGLTALHIFILVDHIIIPISQMRRVRRREIQQLTLLVQLKGGSTNQEWFLTELLQNPCSLTMVQFSFLDFSALLTNLHPHQLGMKYLQHLLSLDRLIWGNLVGIKQYPTVALIYFFSGYQWVSFQMFVECSGFLFWELPSYLLTTFTVCYCLSEFVVCGFSWFFAPSIFSLYIVPVTSLSLWFTF